MTTTRKSWLRRQVLTRVAVYTTEGDTIEGVLDVVARDGVVLRSPVYHDDGEGADHRLAGTVFVPRSTIRFVQVMTEGPA